jgi:hypothetical protein
MSKHPLGFACPERDCCEKYGLGFSNWLVRWFGADWLGGGTARRRQLPRLAVIDSARIDRHRTLVLIRRDNVEQLVVIGPADD